MWTCQLSTKMVLHMVVRRTQESSPVCSYCYKLMRSWWVLIFFTRKERGINKALGRSNKHKVGIRDSHHSLSCSVPIQDQRLRVKGIWQRQAPPEKFKWRGQIISIVSVSGSERLVDTRKELEERFDCLFPLPKFKFDSECGDHFICPVVSDCYRRNLELCFCSFPAQSDIWFSPLLYYQTHIYLFRISLK